MKEKYNIGGMTCSACSAHIEKSLKKLVGIKNINVNLLQNNMTVEYDEGVLHSDEIIETVEKSGYSAWKTNKINRTTHDLKDDTLDEMKEMSLRLRISILFLIPLMYLSMGHMLNLPIPKFFIGVENSISFGLTQMLLVLPVMYVNRKFYKGGFKSLFNRSPNMDSLIAIGSGAAFIYGILAIYRIGYGLGWGDFQLVSKYQKDLYFESASMILTLITLGKFLEARAKGKTSDAIKKLMDLSPKTAIVERNNIEIEIPVEEVKKDDIIIVKPGFHIPVDGEIIEGNTAIDESALTGESIPVEKKVGDKVLSATVNKNGYIKFKATQIGDDTTLAQIIKLVEEASGTKAPIAKLADKVSGVFVPVVIVIAIITIAGWLAMGATLEFAISCGISVLVISCPCALGLATPTAIMVGTGKGAENGILIKSAEALEKAHETQVVVLDKTGTITEGKPKVTDIVTFGNTSEEELLTIAASLEKKSEHPLADAITNYANERKIVYKNVESFRNEPGKGITGRIENIDYFAGNFKLMKNNSVEIRDSDKILDIENKFAIQGKTPLYFMKNKDIIGILAVADTIKSTSKQAIEELHKMKIEVVMLTGDNHKTARAIKEQIAIDKMISDVMPQDKEKEIRNLQINNKVTMIGDGINDAPALKRADVGIAIGSGTDIAIESADIVLMKDDLLDGVSAIQLSKAVMKNIKQNLFWAFFYNILGIPLAAGCFYKAFGIKLSPMFGAAAMSMSSVFVVSNALRLKFFKSSFTRKNNDTINSGAKKIETKEFDEVLNDKKENNKIMKKIIIIEGMMCAHCKGRVEEILNKIDGVSATVDLEQKSAYVNLSKNIDDEILRNAIIAAGYEVKEVK
ncbi:heavy metal translocating P-type ATPase [Fusobacterium sp. PH5-44]|uniref:heavy metal translocating P-type ATPase n=1 Tax=unclassified Fusobacterium TaxID=2648384 RepID=UPI003D22EC44